MTKWKLPEGRRPITDEDMAALARRLAETAIEQSELYEATKRDAEEAEAYVAELEIALGAAKKLLQEARSDLATYVEADYPHTIRSKYPDIQRRWLRDMELCFRIDEQLEPNK